MGFKQSQVQILLPSPDLEYDKSSNHNCLLDLSYSNNLHIQKDVTEATP